MTFAALTRRASKFAVDNSPTILTSIGIVGLGTTAYLAGKASFEAAELIHLKEGTEGYSDDPRQRMKDRVDLVWKLYIPAAATAIATGACIISANRIGVRRAAALAAGYSIAEKAAEEYRAKVIEKFGEKKEELVRAEINQDRVNNSWDDSVEVHGNPTGEVCYDKFSDRYLYNSEEGLRAAANDLNRIVLTQGYATLADFYDIVNMPAPSWAYEIGWSSDGPLMEVRFSSVLTPSGKPVKAFEFDVEPVRNYKRFH